MPPRPGKPPRPVVPAKPPVKPAGRPLPPAALGRKDPHSTPARRRRIIADVARFLVRQYCVKACSNLHTLRVHTAAALVIQCGYRCSLARRVHHMKRLKRWTRCATAIQLVRRAFLAKKELRRLRIEAAVRACLAAAIRLQAWARRLAAARLGALLRAQRRAGAAMVLQRMQRGRKGRQVIIHVLYINSKMKMKMKY
jgi:hypothetical protein